MKKHVTELSINDNGPIMPERRFGTKILANQYLRHNILLFATNILAGAFAYLLHPFLGHIMSVQEYGQVATFIALSLVLATPTQIIATVAARYASSLSTKGDDTQLNDFIRRLTGILLIAGIVTTAVFIVVSGSVASFFHLDSSQEVVIISFVFITVFAAPLNQGVLQGLQFFGWYSVITLLAAFLRLILAIGFIFAGLGVNGAILGIVLSATLTYFASFLPLRKILKGPRTQAGSLRSLWLYSIFAAIAATGIVALYSIDTVLARHFLNASQAGLYAALATVGRIVLFITNSIAIIMFPRVVALHEKGEPHAHIVVQAVLGVLGLGFVVEAVFYLAPSLITKVLFGSAFDTIAALLPLYGVAMLLLAFAQILAMYFLAIGNRIFVLIIFCACVLQIALITWHHAQIVQLVQGVLIANAALAFALSALWISTYPRSKS
jgi:O-antigen/teichoic acid export membrane protein